MGGGYNLVFPHQPEKRLRQQREERREKREERREKREHLLLSLVWWCQNTGVSFLAVLVPDSGEWFEDVLEVELLGPEGWCL